MSKYGVFSDPYFSAFSPNTGKYGPKKPPYLGTFERSTNIHQKSFKMLVRYKAKNALAPDTIKHTFRSLEKSCNLLN